MERGLTTKHGTWGLLLATVVALAVLGTLGVTSASASKAAACSVKNTDTGRTYKALQTAVDAARPGERLVIRGTYGGSTVIDKSLAIRGVKASRTGRPILDGGGHKGRLLRVRPAARVTIRDLTVQGGVVASRYTRSGRYIQGRGAGVLNRGTLRLVDVVVRRNAAWEGAGIYNAGVLRLRGASRVKRNSAAPWCTCRSTGVAGIFNTGIATLRDVSSIRDNYGSGVANHGWLVLNDMSSIQRNHYGVTNSGKLTMNGSTTIRGNRGFEGSQGVNSNGGDVTMNDESSISGHRGGYYTWGLNMHGGGTLTMNGSSVIRDNRAENDLFGGGLGAGPDITLIGVTCGPGGNVHDNSPHDCSFRPVSP